MKDSAWLRERLNYLGAVLAAKRASEELGLDIRFVVGDARFLPFSRSSFDQVFSYSVLQHMSDKDVEQVLSEVKRVLKTDGLSLIQMANSLGLRSLYHQARRRFRSPEAFDVRYRSPKELKKLFETKIGPSDLSVDCFFGLGLQLSDIAMMKPSIKMAILLSEWFRRQSMLFGFLRKVADSLYVKSVKKLYQ